MKKDPRVYLAQILERIDRIQGYMLLPARKVANFSGLEGANIV